MCQPVCVGLHFASLTLALVLVVVLLLLLLLLLVSLILLLMLSISMVSIEPARAPELHIVDFSVTQTTLEDVFLSFARRQRDDMGENMIGQRPLTCVDKIIQTANVSRSSK